MSNPVRRVVAGLVLPVVLPLVSHVAHAATSLASSPTSDTQVELYGIADAGLQYVNHGPSTSGKGGGSLGTESGGLSGSRFGMRGSEDLGNGLHAIFDLEAGIDLTDGESLQSSRLFGRQAYVGLQSKDLGTLTLGRHNTLMITWIAKYTPFGNATMGVKEMDAAFSDRADNAVLYTKNFGPVTLGSYYSFGWNNTESIEDHELGRMIGAGARYHEGPLDAALLYHGKNADAPKTGATSSNREDRVVAGTTYRIDAFKVYGGYRWLRQQLTTQNFTSNMFWVGLGYDSNPYTHWLVGAYKMFGTVCSSLDDVTCPTSNGAGHDQKPALFMAGVTYDLSKRVDLYAYASYLENNHGSGMSVLSNTYGADVTPGENQLGVETGVRVRF